MNYPRFNLFTSNQYNLNDAKDLFAVFQKVYFYEHEDITISTEFSNVDGILVFQVLCM
tara:strand:- start:168 stop:341 length:174 start_codon:yes stop_codon:yes gene_type:complete